MATNLGFFIDNAFAAAYNEDDIDEIYQLSFSNEGGRKANYIIEDLNYKQTQGKICIKDLGYLSIGGADGSEIEYILKNTNISKGLLIEISENAVLKANEKSQSLNSLGKELVVVHGDANAQLDYSLSILENWLGNGLIKGIVVSVQAVLHELPKRSPNFNLLTFLGRIYRNDSWVSTLFYAREPCQPFGWPSQILLKIEGLPNEKLCKFSFYVRDRLKMDGHAEILSSNWLLIDSLLAIETLHKLIRGTSIKRLGYELGEQLTDFKPLLVKTHLETLNEGMAVEVDYVTTLGFKHALSEYEVKYIGIGSEPLPVPKTHVEIVGVKSTYKAAEIDASQINTSKEPESNLTLPEDFVDSLNGEIPNDQIIDWLNQFKPDERPILNKLLSLFTYISWQKLNSLTVQLFEKIKITLQDDISNALFVPLGGIAKSGGMIAYLFRVNNGLRESQFVTADQLINEDCLGKTIVFIDDLLATGHQAVQLIKAIKNNEDSNIHLAVLVSTESGEQYFIEKTGIDVISTIQIMRSDLPLNSENSVFETDEQRFRVTSILEHYGNELAPLGPLGYAGSGLFLAFAYNIPDNSLPIFWSSKDGWKPLFKSAGYNRITN